LEKLASKVCIFDLNTVADISLNLVTCCFNGCETWSLTLTEQHGGCLRKEYRIECLDLRERSNRRTEKKTA